MELKGANSTFLLHLLCISTCKLDCAVMSEFSIGRFEDSNFLRLLLQRTAFLLKLDDKN